MNVLSIKKGIAANARQVKGLTAYAFCPDAIEPPTFYCGEVEIKYHQTYGGDAEVMVMGYLLTSHAEDEAGQALLDQYLSVGTAKSVVDAIEGLPGNPQSLGGACDDLVIGNATGYRTYQVGTGTFYGAKLPITVIGVRSQE
ncbi:hypothetical protein HH310_12575 [Actinoplanes sp. TBRC 11911]|uniref:hypothetical protein n=1 Tax=Actinoplanes sp. TBRC 11911 TaxID=2729386 RepID=UPI00145DE348|nr:hypothetical protein [Actinoplanes sp. TBRC 11911]NMO52028.1 hypothetical protein [Actinoplanes sp. TBRC 11911]